MQGEQGALTSDPVFLLEPTGGSTGPMEPDAHETFTQHCRANGQQIGGIKPSPLHTQTGWSGIFSGALLKPIGKD